MKSVYLACAADRNFFRFIPTMVNSVLKNTSRRLVIGVFYQGVEEKYRNRLVQLFPEVDFHFWEVDPEAFAHLPYKLALSPMIYARVLMARMTNWDDFLYLDLDIIVEGDVGELQDLDIGDHYVGCCRFENGINDGVMKVNGKAWRENDLESKILEWAALNRPKDAEQTAIQEVCGERIKTLDPKWNVLVDPVWGKGTLGEEFWRDAAVTHYITGFKPWNLGYLLLPKGLRQRWNRYRKSGGFPVPLGKEFKMFLYQVMMLAKVFLRKA